MFRLLLVVGGAALVVYGFVSKDYMAALLGGVLIIGTLLIGNN